MIEHGKKSDAAEVSAKLGAVVSGTCLTAVERTGVSWLFSFGSAWEVRTDCWRLIAGGGIAASGDDDGHLFGLSEPFDAAERVKLALSGQVSHLEVSGETADLKIYFGDDRLELLNTSSGYESWMLTVHLAGHRGWLVALGGGGVAGTI